MIFRASRQVRTSKRKNKCGTKSLFAHFDRPDSYFLIPLKYIGKTLEKESIADLSEITWLCKILNTFTTDLYSDSIR